jgi:hypothetical protein
VSANRVLSRISGPKSNEVTEDWIRLHNEGFHDHYFSQNIIKEGN